MKVSVSMVAILESEIYVESDQARYEYFEETSHDTHYNSVQILHINFIGWLRGCAAATEERKIHVIICQTTASRWKCAI